MEKLKIIPKSIGAGAVYPYSESLYAQGAMESRYGDAFNMFRVVGSGEARRIWVPRAMAHDCESMHYAEGLDVTFTSLFKPRNEEQGRIVSESVQLIAQGKNFIVECPTGFGKTACSMDIIAKVGKKVLVVVTKEDLRNQWVKAAQTFLGLTPKEIGFIQGDKFQVAGKKFVIAMIQSLAIEDRYPAAYFQEFGMVIFDEVHRVGADYFSQACFRVPAKIRMGLSATPKRKDGREIVLQAHIGEVLVRTESAPMTPRVIARKSPWIVPMTRIKQKSGAYKVGPVPHSPGKCGHVINMLANHHERNSLLTNFIVAAYKKGRCIIVQSDRKEHLETLSMMCQTLGVPGTEIGFYVGGMKEKDLDKAKVKSVIFATYQMTSEGTDIPWLDTLVMATPKSDVVQIVGRILRPFEGKQDPVVFDLVDYSSSVFSGYWNSRRRWYASKGAEVSTGQS